jgi:predicted permease
MFVDVVVGTTVPLLLLIGIGFISRRIGVLHAGDERVLSAYVYYFALPALFIVDLAETNFFATETLSFIAAGILPVLVVLTVFGLLYLIFRFSTDTFYLLVLCTIFGSLAFFGIPFVSFAFQEQQPEQLATLAAASISIVSVTVSIVILELYGFKEKPRTETLKHVAARLARNPLIISFVVGLLISLAGLTVPSTVSTFLHMLGGTTSGVAIFMLGAFLYGKKYLNLTKAFGLSLLRVVFLPAVALAALTFLFNLPVMEQSIVVLMHAMPVAVSLSVLSERYNFYKETIASVTLISSLGAIIYLNVWLILLGI